MFWFLFAFVISFVSASSVTRPMEDIVLGHNVQNYKVWLWDYYSVSQSEVITIRYEDPINHNLISLPANYATLNLECFEMSYGFEDRGGGWYEDVITFETYDDNCYIDMVVEFESDSSLNQAFRLTISNSSSSVVENPLVYYNISYLGFLNSLVGYLPLDDNYKDYSLGGYDGVVEGGVLNLSSGGKLGKYMDISNYGYLNLTSMFKNKIPSSSNTNFTVSFWVKFSESGNSGPKYIFSCANSDYLAQYNFGIDYIAFYGTEGLASLNNTLSKNVWHNIVLRSSGGEAQVFYDGNIDTSSLHIGSLNYDNNFCRLGSHSVVGGFLGVDEFMLFNRSLQESEVLQLYNSGSGLNISGGYSPLTPTNSSIPNIYLNQSSYYNISYSTYFTGWGAVYLKAQDPIQDYIFNLYPGYSTLNADYYELFNFANAVQIQTYARPYNFTLTFVVCNTTMYTNCREVSTNVYIGGSLSNVEQINEFLYSYDLGLDVTDYTTFAGNYFFQYYDRFYLTMPDSNYTGTVGDGTHSYFTVQNNSQTNLSYMVIFECNLTGGAYTYNYLGDVNLTAECGDGQTYFILSPYNNYNQRVYFAGVNSQSSVSDFTLLFAGNSDYPAGYIPDLSVEDTNTNFIDNNINVFSSLLPQDITASAKKKVVFIVLFIVNGLFIMSFIRYGFWCLVLCFGVTTIILFLFASANYITNALPVLSLFVTVLLIYLGVKR